MNSQVDKEALKREIVEDFRKGIAEIEALPDVGSVFQFENSLCVGFADGKPFAGGLKFAKIFDAEPPALSFRNGNGEPALPISLKGAKKAVIANFEKAIKQVEEA